MPVLVENSAAGGDLGFSRVCRDPEQMNAPGPDLDDERDVKALERDRAAGVKEVRGQQRGGVGAQEGAPGIVAVRWWRDVVSAQDLADGGGRDPGVRAGVVRPGS